MWKRGGDTLDLLEHPGHRDVVTPGLRAQGGLPRRLDYNVEMALPRGHVVGDRISAWAGHWEIGWKPLGNELGPRLGLEHNFASGDTNPGDGRHNTFDDLYPGGDEFLVRNPAATGSHIGNQVFFSTAYARSERWHVYAGYGHLFPGACLRQSGCPTALRTVYLLSSFTL